MDKQSDLKAGDRIGLIPTDPWDLVTALGSGPFTGTVTAVGQLNQAAAIVISLDQPLSYKTKSAQLFQASTRSPSSHFRAARHPERVFCNVSSVSQEEFRNGIAELGTLDARLRFLGDISIMSPTSD